MLTTAELTRSNKRFMYYYRGVVALVGRADTIEWIYGDMRQIKVGNSFIPYIIDNSGGFKNSAIGLPVCPESVGRFTGVMGTDSTGEKPEALYEGDIVDFLGMTGEIVFESGAFGIAFRNQIDWDMVEVRIPEITGCRNRLFACKNDNFISLWEILWNFNIEEDNCGDLIKVIGNTYEKSKGENE